jgi:NAD+ synthase (glutamine-hydrolysing)
MPTKFNSDITKGVAKKLADNIGCKYEITSIEDYKNKVYDDIKLDDEKLTDFQMQNVQARIRCNILSTWASLFNGVFTCNSNKSEMTVGYCTFYGDLSGFVAPIGDLWKTQVYEMAKWYNENIGMIIPEEVFTIPPSAELSDVHNVDEGKGDPLIYEYHDLLFKSWVERWNRATPSTILNWISDSRLEVELGWHKETQILDLFNSKEELIEDLKKWWNAYNGLAVAKRIQSPPIISVSRRAFGYDHRESQV